LAHTSVKRNLSILVRRNLIISSIIRRGKRKFPVYKANTESREFNKHKKLHNYHAVISSGLVEYLEDIFMPKAIVLFGSYARGEDTEGSDIDIFIEAKREDIDIKQFERKLKRKIELHFKEKFKEYPKELKNSIINGIILQGYLEEYK